MRNVRTERASLGHNCTEMNALSALRFSVSYCENDEICNTHKNKHVSHTLVGQFDCMLHGGSTGRASASKSHGLHDQRFESRPELKKNL